ncbi:single-stranded DNA-binding protein [Candidatus Thorarchaeota archaeon]|nr:MAG: single-stranded DNA-binding protein [Candidatus Thorarchaeota archaeon]
MKTDYDPIEMEIAELKPRMKRLKVTFKVLEKSNPREVTIKRDDSNHQIADAVVADETGSVVMPLWDKMIDEIEVGRTYTLSNGYTGTFRGSLRLNIGKYGKITDAEEEIDGVNLENDVSELAEKPHYYRGKGT